MLTTVPGTWRELTRCQDVRLVFFSRWCQSRGVWTEASGRRWFIFQCIWTSHRDLCSLGSPLPSWDHSLIVWLVLSWQKTKHPLPITQLAWIPTTSTSCLVCLPHGGMAGHPSRWRWHSAWGSCPVRGFNDPRSRSHAMMEEESDQGHGAFEDALCPFTGDPNSMGRPWKEPPTHGLFNHILFAVYPLLMAELLPNYLSQDLDAHQMGRSTCGLLYLLHLLSCRYLPRPGQRRAGEWLVEGTSHKLSLWNARP